MAAFVNAELGQIGRKICSFYRSTVPYKLGSFAAGLGGCRGGRLQVLAPNPPEQKTEAPTQVGASQNLWRTRRISKSNGGHRTAYDSTAPAILTRGLLGKIFENVVNFCKTGCKPLPRTSPHF
jgi:hypothetical protein